MSNSHSFHPSGARFHVVYGLRGPEPAARSKAQSICFEQTVEADEHSVPAGAIREHLVGRVEDFAAYGAESYRTTISYPCELLTGDFVSLLNVMYGIASLKQGVRVLRLELPDSFLTQWRGPRFGCAGLRSLVDVTGRPLVCGVLKPLGLSPTALADQAHQFALAGIDVVKDDQGLGDQEFCPFEERVKRCAEAVAQANRLTGKRCIYVSHVSAEPNRILDRCTLAIDAGAGGVLVCSGLVGFDTLHHLTIHTKVAVPVVSHPSFLGSYYVHPESGLAPEVLFGQLMRLAGADVSIYPSFGAIYPISSQDCRKIMEQCRSPWGTLKPTLPSAAGQISRRRIPELVEFYGPDVMFILGSHLTSEGESLGHAAQTFVRELENSIR